MKFVVIFSMLFPDFGDNGTYLRTTDDMNSWFKMPLYRVNIEPASMKGAVPQAYAYSNTLEVINPYRSIEINTFKTGFGLSAYNKPQFALPAPKLENYTEQVPEVIYTWAGH